MKTSLAIAFLFLFASSFSAIVVGDDAADAARKAEKEEIKKKAKEELKKSAGKAPAAAKPDAAPALSITETIHDYKTVGDKILEVYVYRQPDDKVRPVMLLLHPGALMVGQAKLSPVLPGKPIQRKAKFLQQGYAIVSVEYRLAPEAKLPEIVEDVQDAYKWVREKGPELLKIDPRRVGVIGSSAGGYLTLLSGYSLTPRPNVLISISGYGDITGDWYSNPDPFYRQRPLVTEKQAFRPNAGSDLYLYCRQNGLWPKVLTGHDPATEPDWFKPYCPVQNVTKDYPPTFLLHGDQDTDVPYQQSAQMDKELTAKGIDHVFVLNPGAGHGIDASRGNDEKIYDQILAFAGKYMK